jgi:serine/threonine-protein kinase HipA
MSANGINPRIYVPQDKLYVWALVDPTNPTLVGEVSLSSLVSDCATFAYAPEWWNFPLSEFADHCGPSVQRRQARQRTGCAG